LCGQRPDAADPRGGGRAPGPAARPTSGRRGPHGCRRYRVGPAMASRSTAKPATSAAPSPSAFMPRWRNWNPIRRTVREAARAKRWWSGTPWPTTSCKATASSSKANASPPRKPRRACNQPMRKLNRLAHENLEPFTSSRSRAELRVVGPGRDPRQHRTRVECGSDRLVSCSLASSFFPPRCPGGVLDQAVFDAESDPHEGRTGLSPGPILRA
jgi:hypothetical protein